MRVFVAAVAAFGCTALMHGPAAAQDCAQSVRDLANRSGIVLAIPSSGGGAMTSGEGAITPPAAPATNESLGVGVMTRLEGAGSVHPGPDGAAGSSATADAPGGASGASDDVHAREATRIQAEALLNEAVAAAQTGRPDECRAKVDTARSLLSMPEGSR